MIGQLCSLTKCLIRSQIRCKRPWWDQKRNKLHLPEDEDRNWENQIIADLKTKKFSKETPAISSRWVCILLFGAFQSPAVHSPVSSRRMKLLFRSLTQLSLYVVLIRADKISTTRGETSNSALMAPPQRANGITLARCPASSKPSSKTFLTTIHHLMLARAQFRPYDYIACKKGPFTFWRFSCWWPRQRNFLLKTNSRYFTYLTYATSESFTIIPSAS